MKRKITTVDELREYVESVVMPAAAEQIAQSERDLMPMLYVFDGDELTLIALAVDLDNRTKNMIATAMKALVLVGAQAVAFVSETWVVRLAAADEARFRAWRDEDPERSLAEWPDGGVEERLVANGACWDGSIFCQRKIVREGGRRRLIVDKAGDLGRIVKSRFVDGLPFVLQKRIAGMTVNQVLDVFLAIRKGGP
jgi:hypothetical protein